MRILLVAVALAAACLSAARGGGRGGLAGTHRRGGGVNALRTALPPRSLTDC